jgi:hypothetical protein
VKVALSSHRAEDLNIKVNGITEIRNLPSPVRIALNLSDQLAGLSMIHPDWPNDRISVA